MRVTVGIDGDPGEEFDMANFTNTGIDVEILINGIPSIDKGSDLNIGAATPEGPRDVIIPAGATLDDAIVILCRPTSKSSGESGSHDMPKQFSGSLVIWAALSSVGSHDEWRRIFHNPADENDVLNRVLLEVPFKVDVFI